MHPKTQSPQTGVPATRQCSSSGMPVKVLANTFAIRTLPMQTIFHYNGGFCRSGWLMHMLIRSRHFGPQLVRRVFSRGNCSNKICPINLTSRCSHHTSTPHHCVVALSCIQRNCLRGHHSLGSHVQNDDPDLWGNTASPTGPDRAEGPEGTSHVPADDPKL
jgi:hypothetical protein